MSLADYVKSIGLSDPVVTKIENLMKLANIICPEPIEDFFVTEYRQSDKQRVYESALFFSPKYVMESEKLMSSGNNLDITCTFKNIDGFRITYNNYDPLQPEKTSDDSLLQIENKIGDIFLDLKGSGENCARLWSIFTKYVKPNIVEIVEIPPDGS